MRRVLIASVLAASTVSCLPAQRAVVTDPCDGSHLRFENTIACYQQTVERQPPQYFLTSDRRFSGVEQRTYHMRSQAWSPEQLVQTSEWIHDVTLYIPEHARHSQALIVVNNGTRYGDEAGVPVQATDFSPEALAMIARKTNTVVVSVSDVPNQYLTYSDDGKSRSEDNSVAHSWLLFTKAPERRATLPLHVPMVAAISRAMTLAERELTPLDIHRFVISGISKRAWVSWLTAIADPRIDAIVPFAIDLLNTRETLKHMYQSYGGNWPIAFYPYYNESIDRNIDTLQFRSLMQIEDPLNYLGTRYAARLAIPKYIISASGDDFFVPDSASFYYDRLPGSKAIRMVPNSSHSGIRDSSIDSLISFLNRFQNAVALPEIRTTLLGSAANLAISFHSSEPPKTLALWHATNPDARDFRYACGVRYTLTSIDLSSARVPVEMPDFGWSTYFIEATFADGFVATSQAYIVGKKAFPVTAPPAHGATCQTLPGRGFGP